MGIMLRSHIALDVERRMPRQYHRNFDIPEEEDFELNVKPFVNPGEFVQPIVKQYGQTFCGALVEDNRVMVGWEVITMFSKD